MPDRGASGRSTLGWFDLRRQKLSSSGLCFHFFTFDEDPAPLHGENKHSKTPPVFIERIGSFGMPGLMSNRVDRPVLLIDQSDDCASRGTQNTMAVLAEAMRQELKDMAVAAIRDPEAAEAMIPTGVGSRVTIQLGGKINMPAIRLKRDPLEVTGTLRVISDGEFTV